MTAFVCTHFAWKWSTSMKRKCNYLLKLTFKRAKKTPTLDDVYKTNFQILMTLPTTKLFLLYRSIIRVNSSIIVDVLFYRFPYTVVLINPTTPVTCVSPCTFPGGLTHTHFPPGINKPWRVRSVPSTVTKQHDCARYWKYGFYLSRYLQAKEIVGYWEPRLGNNL